MQRQYKGSSCLEVNGEKIILEYYLIFENKFFSEIGSSIAVYGIEIVKDNNEMELIKDVTPDELFASELIELLKSSSVFPVHLYDIIEDML